MPAFAEFLLVAFLIYLWESGLWLPKRGISLRRRWFGDGWRVVLPGRWLATRELGVVPMLPFPPDAGLVPCGGFPLVVDDTGRIFSETVDGDFRETGAVDWDDFHWEPPRLRAGSSQVRCQSPLGTAPLRAAKAAGISPAAAIREIWQDRLNPARAVRELQRWRIATSGLRWLPLPLMLGFFGGLPVAYLFGGLWQVLAVVGVIWCLMAVIACQLWWLGKRVFPAARADLRMDALLSLLVPFHAMRAVEIASVHAFANTHPVAILIGTGDLKNPWLGKFIRHLLHPRPGNRGDAARAATIRPILARLLARHGIALADYDAPPTVDDADATSFCPRCHAMFAPGPENCPDCAQLPVRQISRPH